MKPQNDSKVTGQGKQKKKKGRGGDRGSIGGHGPFACHLISAIKVVINQNVQQENLNELKVNERTKQRMNAQAKMKAVINRIKRSAKQSKEMKKKKTPWLGTGLRSPYSKSKSALSGLGLGR